MPIGFAIFGSCVTRDAFEISADRTEERRVRLYLARTTINSCLSRPVDFRQLFPAGRDRKFEERCVVDDIFKLHFGQLREAEFDRLIVDLIDERHHVLKVGDAFVCYSVPFTKMAETLGVDLSRHERFSPHDPAIVQSTLERIPEFVTRLREILPPERIVLHEALWARRYRATTGETREFPKERQVEATNAILEEYYAAIRRACPEMSSIRLPEDHILADEAHRWTLEPFHYADSYYAEFIRRLDALTG